MRDCLCILSVIFLYVCLPFPSFIMLFFISVPFLIYFFLLTIALTILFLWEEGGGRGMSIGWVFNFCLPNTTPKENPRINKQDCNTGLQEQTLAFSGTYLLGGIPWVRALEGWCVGIQENWLIFKHCFLQAQDQCIPMSEKPSKSLKGDGTAHPGHPGLKDRVLLASSLQTHSRRRNIFKVIYSG